jgi:hypothetical protein
VVSVIGDTAIDPDMALALSKPVLVQKSALVEDQLKVALSPSVISMGLAVSVAVGNSVTDTKTFAVAVPPGPLQVMV